MDCTALISRYVRRLQDDFYCEAVQGGFVLYTPYTRPDNDAIEVYVIGPGEDGSYTLTDRGETIHYLSSFGPDFLRSRPRALQLQHAVRSNGVDLSGDEIRATAKEHELPEAVFRLIQALREASDLVHLLRTASRPAFRDQVASFLSQLGLPAPVREGYELEGVHGRWRVDFYINGRFNVVIEAITASTGGYAQTQLSTTFMKLYDLRRRMTDLRAFTVLDDQESRLEVWPTQELRMLQEQSAIVRWGERNQLRRALADRQRPQLGG